MDILSDHALLVLPLFLQGSNGSWKTWKVLEFYYGIFQDWKVLEKAFDPGKFWKSVTYIHTLFVTPERAFSVTNALLTSTKKIYEVYGR